MQAKIMGYLVAGLVFLVRKILVFDLIFVLLILASFFIWGPFNYTALSERLVLSGLAMSMISGLLVFSQTSGGRTFGVPGQFIGSVHAQTIIDWNIEVRQAIETKMGIFPRIFAMGAVLFALGVVVQQLFPNG